MKPRSRLCFLFAILTFSVASSAPAGRAPDPNTGVTLQVQVTLPADHQPNPDSQLVSAFVSRIRDTFAAQGYVGAIAEATSDRDVPNETAVLLKVDVTELRMRDNEVDLRYTVRVRTHAEELELGTFREKGLRWNRTAAQLGARKPEQDPTLLRLYRAVAASRLVPGLTPE